MRITIDISPIIYGTGVSVYTKNIVENLLLIDKMNDYTLFGGSFRRIDELEDYVKALKSDKVRSKIFPIPPTLADIVWNKLHVFPIEMLTGKIDVLHSSDWTQPPSRAFKVTTVHDLSPVLFPELTTPKVVSAHKRRLNWVVKEVDRVIVPTMTTAQDIINLGVPKNKIRIIPEAVDVNFKPASKSSVDELKLKYKLGKYILAIGVNSRKNTKRIIAAFEKIKKELGVSLVVLGQPHMHVEPTEDVIFTGHIPERELSSFHTGAEVLVYPSIYEGFGIPILEAYTCGTPVVTSNVGSMAETSGNAAVLVNPIEVDSIANGILRAVKHGREFSKKGLAYVKQFSWQKSAKATLDVYKEAF